jgi:SAM-dependent methyltransferase
VRSTLTSVGTRAAEESSFGAFTETARALASGRRAEIVEWLVNTRRDGTRISYRLASDRVAEMWAAMRDAPVEHVAGIDRLAEARPVDDGRADVVIFDGVIDLCADKRAVLTETRRVLEPGGWLQFADIANGGPVTEDAVRDIDLWTG